MFDNVFIDDICRFDHHHQTIFVLNEKSFRKMTKAYEFNWCRPVPNELFDGNTFDVWEEVFIGSKVNI